MITAPNLLLPSPTVGTTPAVSSYHNAPSWEIFVLYLSWPVIVSAVEATTLDLLDLSTKKPWASNSGLSKLQRIALDYELVPKARLELARVAPLPPQDSVSTSSTTSAFFIM